MLTTVQCKARAPDSCTEQGIEISSYSMVNGVLLETGWQTSRKQQAEEKQRV